MAIVLAYAGYVVFKFFGYVLAARVLGTIVAPPGATIWRVGLVRTILGIVVGAAYTATFGAVARHGLFEGLPLNGGRGGAILWYPIGLLPVRVLEWSWLIWYFFDRAWARPARNLGAVALGVIWSFVLDLPAMVAGVWFVSSIC